MAVKSLVVPSAAPASLNERISDRTATIGVMGLGYVGLPLAVAFAEAGFPTIGYDVDSARLESVARGHSYVDDLPSEILGQIIEERNFTVSEPKDHLAEPDALIICLPTPLNKSRDPDLSILAEAFRTIRSQLRAGQLIVLSSTTYPGTTEDLALPTLESSGLRAGRDFFLAFSPERIDPGRRFPVRSIPRVVGGITPTCASMAQMLLATIVDEVHAVSNCRTAEMTKLLENTFRSVNIALVNEMAIICKRLGVDVWEVVDAASTKPFGFMRFEPGPGLGGHCIPIDPAYLAWRLRMLNYRTRFVELAEDINSGMPEFVAELVANALNEQGKAVRGAAVLALGVAYKRDVADARESPAVEVIAQLVQRGARVIAHDPLVTRKDLGAFELMNGELTDDLIEKQDCVVILTDHACYKWERILSVARLVVDTRGVSRHLPNLKASVVRL